MYDLKTSEDLISKNITDFIDNDEFLLLPLPMIYRIFQNSQLSQRNLDVKSQTKIFNFIYKCLDKFGGDASILFLDLDLKINDSVGIDLISKLNDKYANIINYRMINSKFLINIINDLYEKLKLTNHVNQIKYKYSNANTNELQNQMQINPFHNEISFTQSQKINELQSIIEKQKNQIEKLKNQINEQQNQKQINSSQNEISIAQSHKMHELQSIIEKQRSQIERSNQIDEQKKNIIEKQNIQIEKLKNQINEQQNQIYKMKRVQLDDFQKIDKNTNEGIIDQFVEQSSTINSQQHQIEEQKNEIEEKQRQIDRMKEIQHKENDEKIKKQKGVFRKLMLKRKYQKHNEQRRKELLKERYFRQTIDDITDDYKYLLNGENENNEDDFENYENKFEEEEEFIDENFYEEEEEEIDVGTYDNEQLKKIILEQKKKIQLMNKKINKLQKNDK